VRVDAPVRVDMARVKARKDGIVQQSRDGVRAWLDGARNVTVIEGHAQFTRPHRVQVRAGAGERELEAPRIFINAGGRAAVPDMPGVADVPFLNNERILQLDRLPEHLVVIGGSYIGLEFAQMYRRFGSRVTVVEAGPRLVGREDEDVSTAIADILAAEGIEFRLNATCIALQRRGDHVAVGVDCGDGPPLVEGTHILLATGRVPNTHDLGLPAAGIQTDPRGYITVGEDLATSVEGVYALGDCNGRGAFTHTSWNDYEIVAANLFDGAARKVSDRIPVYALFVDPPLGRVGMTHAQVLASGRPALAAKMMMTRVGRAREMGETAGFMKVAVAADTREILGAAILGVHGDEVIHALLEVMTARQPHTVINRGMHIHPTVSELLPTLLEGLAPMR
jgi:pyruvate/2-oxoglutarate dehydrogenase complex dihydrolipoamide dehydrogenase (E3) component